MPSIKNFSLSIDKLDESGTFSEGDTVSGAVSLELTKKTTIGSLSVKLEKFYVAGGRKIYLNKGLMGNKLLWLGMGSMRRQFIPDEFWEEKFLISTKVKETELPPGSHSFRFDLKLPCQATETSIQSTQASINYQVQATLRRRNKKKRQVQEPFEVHSKFYTARVSMSPQNQVVLPKNAVSGADVQMVAMPQMVFNPNSLTGANFPLVQNTGGGVQLPGGGVQLPGGGVQLPGGGVQLPGGGVQLPGGGVQLTGGAAHILSYNPNSVVVLPKGAF